MSKNDVKSSIPVFRATVLVLVDALLIWIVRGPLAKAPPLQGLEGFYLLTIGLVAMTAAFRRLWDGKDVGSLGFRNPFGLRDFGMGLLLGFLLTGAILLVEMAAGWIKVLGTRTSALVPIVLLAVLQQLPVAVWEETVFRGYVLQNLELGLGTNWAVALSSVAFGVGHLLGRTVSGWTVYVIPVTLSLLGVMFASAYLVRRSLYLPIALHISWNVFGFRVFSLAGNPLKSVAFLATEMTGPGVWVGLPHSDFGPEVGLLGVLAMLLGTLLLLKIWRRVSRADARHSRR